jgi:hypothetical protein
LKFCALCAKSAESEARKRLVGAGGAEER